MIDQGPDTPVRELWTVEGLKIARLLGSDPEAGVSADDATEGLARFGPNRLDAADAVPPWFTVLGAGPAVHLP